MVKTMTPEQRAFVRRTARKCQEAIKKGLK